MNNTFVLTSAPIILTCNTSSCVVSCVLCMIGVYTFITFIIDAIGIAVFVVFVSYTPAFTVVSAIGRCYPSHDA